MMVNRKPVMVLLTLLLFALNTNPTTLSAEDTKQASEVNSEQLASLELVFAAIEQQKKEISYLQKRVAKKDGLGKKIATIRLDKAWLGLLEQGVSFAEAVVASLSIWVVVS